MERGMDGKKIMAITTLALVFAMAILLICCGWDGGDVTIRAVGDRLTAPVCEPAEVELYCMIPPWNDMGSKHVTGSYGGQLAQALSALKPDGQTVPALAEEDSANAVWAEYGGRIYRMHNGQLALVQERFGEGQVLADAEETMGLLGKAWAFYPRDYYYGEYKDGVLELEHRFAGDTALRAEIIQFSVNHEADTHFGSEGSVKIRLRSEADWEGQLYVRGLASSDNFASTQRKTVKLRAGMSEVLTMSFKGWSRGYWVEIWAENTMIMIRVNGNDTT